MEQEEEAKYMMKEQLGLFFFHMPNQARELSHMIKVRQGQAGGKRCGFYETGFRQLHPRV